MIDYKIRIYKERAIVFRADNINNPTKHSTCLVKLDGISGNQTCPAVGYRIFTDEMTYGISTNSV
jgi:hypothetical protein